jgi:hypothetical protein
MIHTLDSYYPQTATISIEDIENKNIKITVAELGDARQCILDLKGLHSFIGTLLHVQQKIKNS